MFHPNSEPHICHDLTLQIISYQIKDNMHNHGSIGLFWEVGFWWGIWLLSVLAFPLSVFSLFSLVRRETSAGTKVWVATREVTALGIPQVSNKLLFASFSFSFLTILHIVQTLSCPKNLFVFFLSFFSILFLLSSNLWLVDFLFFFSFEAHL